MTYCPPKLFAGESQDCMFKHNLFTGDVEVSSEGKCTVHVGGNPGGGPDILIGISGVGYL